MNIQFHKTYTSEEEINEVVDTIKSGWLTMGPKTIKFEEKFKKFIQCDHALSVNSCTAALHLSLKAIKLQADDEVIIPTNTFISTAEVITYFNAIPVLCDIELSTHNIDVSKIESLITKKTKAIIAVHFAGQPCDLDEIHTIAKKHNLIVIEDAAHAIPSTYKNIKIGNYSDLTCFSFYATKTLATGEGGMVTTNNPAFVESIRVNRLHGLSKDAWNRYSDKGHWHYDVIDNGYKYNMTDISASLGLVQLKRLEWMLKERSNIANKYENAFKNTSIETLIQKKDRTSAKHLYVIKINNRDELAEILKSKGIGVSVHFIPVHLHTYYKENYNFKFSNFKNANTAFEKSLSLPIYPDLSNSEIDFIIENVLKYAK